jgi:hypothetical protein
MNQGFLLRMSFFNRIMTPSTPPYRPPNGLKTIISMFWTGLPQSPDINPIEHLWQHIKLWLGEYSTMPKGVWEIWERVAEVWNKIPPEVCQNLIESLPRRLEAVIKATYKVLEFLVSGFLTGSYKIDSMIP